MVGLFRFAIIVLVVCIMPEISPYRVNAQIFEPHLQDEIEPYTSDTEYDRNRVQSMLNENEDTNVEMDLQSVFKDTKLGKRNGDLINFLLGLPKGMLDAGR